MKMQRILPIMTAALVAGACTGDTTSPTAAPAGPRMDGSQAGGSGGVTGGETPSYESTTPPDDSTALTRCCQMGGSGR